MNLSRDVVDAADPARLALVALSADGRRREIAFGEVADRSARLAGPARNQRGTGGVSPRIASLRAEGVERSEIVP